MENQYDVLIIGGGPGGSAAAITAAKAGLKVCLFEKAVHPRFHIGETLLPRLMDALQELDLLEDLKKIPTITKVGAEFNMGNDFTPMNFYFRDGLLGGQPVFNVERAHLDKMMIDAARRAGAEVHENTTVKKILKLEEGACELQVGTEVYRGRMLLDASGHSTMVGRHFNRRQNFDDPELQKVAYFNHFEGVETSTPDRFPCIVMCKEGWFWLIQVNETRMSVGFVTRPSFVKELNVPPDRILNWAIKRCPVVRHRMRNATGPTTNLVLADFSYTCKPFAGPGYFLIGDAGCFLDPIFSTGVTLATVGGIDAAKHTVNILSGKVDPEKARTAYCNMVRDSTSIFWRIIKNYYKQPFRELFMNGQGPLQVHNATFSLLAGHVFPKPVWAIRWRMKFFWICMFFQRFLPLVPHRKECVLTEEEPIEMPNLTDSVAGAEHAEADKEAVAQAVAAYRAKRQAVGAK